MMYILIPCKADKFCTKCPGSQNKAKCFILYCFIFFIPQKGVNFCTHWMIVDWSCWRGPPWPDDCPSWPSLVTLTHLAAPPLQDAPPQRRSPHWNSPD